MQKAAGGRPGSGGARSAATPLRGAFYGLGQGGLAEGGSGTGGTGFRRPPLDGCTAAGGPIHTNY